MREKETRYLEFIVGVGGCEGRWGGSAYDHTLLSNPGQEEEIPLTKYNI